MKTVRTIRECLFALCAAFAVLPAARAADNCWQAAAGQYGGKWSEAAHWSLGHVPTADETVVIDPVGDTTTTATFAIEVDGDYEIDTLVVSAADGARRNISVTFTGSGSVTAAGSDTYKFGTCTSVTLDGPSVTLNKGSGKVMLYSRLTVTGGSTLVIPDTDLQFWNGQDFLTVGNGGTVTVGGISYRNPLGDRSITVEAGGRLVCNGRYFSTDDAIASANKFALLIDGGDVEIENLDLSRAAASVRMTAGSLRLAKRPTVVDASTQFDVTGGSLVFGFDVVQDASDPFAALLANEGLSGIGCGTFTATNGVTLTSRGTFFVSQIKVGDKSAPARIDCDTIVFDGAKAPFAYANSGNRVVHLYGPTDIYADGKDVSGFNNHYISGHGAITVHTEDWSDRTTARTVALRGLNSADGSLDLVVTGGGTFKFGQAYSHETMRSCTVEAGTTLDLGDRNTKTNAFTEWGPLVAETLTLGANAKVTLKAGEQHLAASTWNVDSTATITVTIPETYTSEKIALPSGGFPVLQDLDSKALPDALLSQITLAGATDGWTLVNEYGQISVVKNDTELLGTLGAFEWLGGTGADGSKWSVTANWNGGTPAENQAHVFGVSENRVPTFNAAKADGTGATLGSVTFASCAGRSFFIDRDKQATFGKSPSVRSDSRVPQLLAVGFRLNTASERLISSTAGAPIVFAGKSFDGTKDAMTWLATSTAGNFWYEGDVRMGCGSKDAIGIAPKSAKREFPSWRSCLTVIDGGSLTLGKQTAAFDVASAAFRVSKGGALAFTMADGATYKWTQAPASLVVDGSLTIGPALVGGKDQVYRGSGAVTLAGGATPGTASSRVKFADALTVTLPGDWNTAVAGSEAVALALGATAGEPVLHVPADWTYGAAEGVTATSDASDRAFAIENGAVAVIDPNGGTATVAEAVAGEGALAITNGTLVLAAASEAPGVRVAVRADAALAVSAAQSLAALELASGTTATLTAEVTADALDAADAALVFEDGGGLRLSGDVSVEGVAMRCTGSLASWRTILTTDGTITGTPTLPEGVKCRIATSDGETRLRIKAITGGMLIIR